MTDVLTAPAWVGCDWPTAFGATGLDLNGIRSAQALLMARATAGAEAADWREAVRWLALVEADAAEAAAAGRRAADLAARGDLAAALREARRAEALEARYHPAPGWRALVRSLEARPTP
jgi:hypothetical protein